MKKLYLLCALLGALCVQSLSAQVIKGDMNDDGVFNVTDVSESVNTVLGKRAIQYVQGGGDPYMVDNSRVVGTWYKTKSDHFTLNADGTTDYSGASTFRFLPYQGCIMFFDSSSWPVTFIDVRVLEDGYMVCIPRRTDALTVLTTEVPAQPVTAIQLSASSLEMSAGEFKQLTATVLPEDADNKSVTWESSNESVAKVMGDLVLAIANGTAVITCRAADGSGVKAECTVTVQEKTDSHDFVDLGLPGGVLWATCNVGADKPEDYGLYFAWGETVGYANGESHGFDWDNYKWMTPGRSSWQYVTKYTTADGHKNCCWYDGDTYVGTNVDGVTYKNLTKLLPEDDAATANWGSSWRMPTMQEMKDLYDSRYTTTEWVTVNGVSGRKVTSKSNGNSIFLPAAGCYIDTSLYNDDSDGYYWSGELDSSRSYYAYYLYFFSDYFDQGNDYRYHGLSVRPVRVLSE